MRSTGVSGKACDSGRPAVGRRLVRARWRGIPAPSRCSPQERLEQLFRQCGYRRSATVIVRMEKFEKQVAEETLRYVRQVIREYSLYRVYRLTRAALPLSPATRSGRSGFSSF